MKKWTLLPLFLALGVSSYALAKPTDVQFGKNISGEVPFYDNFARVIKKQPIQFERFVFSANAKKYLADRLKSTDKPLPRNNTIPSAYNLGMNNVQPLNQGAHGTCVTFAVSAALEASIPTNLDPKYYVSELCSLELGAYLNSLNSNYPSGWSGSWSTTVLRQMQTHGVVLMMYQHNPGCAGVFDYPVNDANNTGNLMSEEEYANLAQFMFPTLAWRSLFNLNAAVDHPIISATDVLQNVRQAVYGSGNGYDGDRVLMAFLLDPSVNGIGTDGSYKKTNDTWVLTPQIVQDIANGKVYAGHDIIIIGYDDNAVVTTADGQQHQGVLTLRNSWGASAGDGGNYYMTYDYFYKLAIDLQEILPGGSPTQKKA